MKLIIKGLGLSALVLSMFAHADSKTLNVYAWGGYLPEASLKA
ncbi:spermidine/putrescine ABC transporter substrate-binding protein PotD, partial [Vibrio parahaemolyticus]|nr:spermidine/putrescine ABC transporter substrate-binding protein PotD [Vibrio parahaemolyticus]